MPRQEIRFDDYAVTDDALMNRLAEAYVETLPDRGRGFRNSPQGERDIANNAYRRYNRTIRNVLPWIQKVYDLRGKRVLEIGAGTGSTGVAFAKLAGRVVSCEPEERWLRVAEARAGLLGVTNVEFHQGVAPGFFDDVERRGDGPFDIVLLPAVLEHQTHDERLETIKRAWELLGDDGVLIVLELPNRLTYFDYHTSRLAFFDMLPDPIAMRTYHRSPRGDFVESMDAAVRVSREEADHTLARRGRGVSVHDFDAALGGRPYTILADGYEKRITNVFGVTYEERLLQSYVAMFELDIPTPFLRQTIFTVLNKGGGRAGLPRRPMSPFVATRGQMREIRDLARAGKGEKAAQRIDDLLMDIQLEVTALQTEAITRHMA